MSNTSKRHCTSLVFSDNEDDSTNHGTNTDTEAKRSETPCALKRKLASQPIVSFKSEALFMQWISHPKRQ